jgi:hypothetical protein
LKGRELAFVNSRFFIGGQAGHIWHGTMIANMLLFSVESMPVLAILAGLIFLAKAGSLADVFSIDSEKLFVTSLAMSALPKE